MIRFFGHFEGDAQTYRGKGEVDEIRLNHDCIKILTGRLLEAGVVQKAELDAIDRAVGEKIEDAVQSAKAAPLPLPKELMTDVYVAY
jgi:Pyruvate/2-oxoglutarate dehydrogenase complex, dehydrogenase (E1) component, eukaryotic type, alpha subunit